MKNEFSSNLAKVIATVGLMATVFCFNHQPVYSQIIPQAWASLGGKDGDFTYAGGIKFFSFGLEVGVGEDGATGGDILKFINIPTLSAISPYVGIGFYSGDDTFAYSGGVHLNPRGNFFVGGGYHSIRGINGQIGIKF